MPPSPIRYACDCTYSGYGYAARGYLRALEALGWDRSHVRVVPAVFWRQEAHDAPEQDWLRKTYLDAYDDRPAPDIGINVVHVHPCWLGMFWASNWYNIAVTAWETNQLPRGTYPCAAGTQDKTVIETLNERYDEVWVPTPAVREVFLSSGVTTPVFVVPHALVSELLAEPKTESPVIPEQHPAVADGPGVPCRFYAIGSWDQRKDPTALLQAYWRTDWKVFDPVSLLLHTSKDGLGAQADVSALRCAVQDWSMLPSMSLSTRERKPTWVADLHKRSHVYVTATHGEGFCLPAVEALAAGNLVMGPRGPLSHLDWAAEAGFAVLLDSVEQDIAVMPSHAGYEIGQTWWTVPSKVISRGFREAFDRVKNGLLPLSEGAEEARKRYSVESAAALIKPRLEEAERVLASRQW